MTSALNQNRPVQLFPRPSFIVYSFKDYYFSFVIRVGTKLVNEGAL